MYSEHFINRSTTGFHLGPGGCTVNGLITDPLKGFIQDLEVAQWTVYSQIRQTAERLSNVHRYLSTGG